MDYKDKTFEIDGEKIKFDNKTFNLYLPIFFPLFCVVFFFNRSSLPAMLGGITGLVLLPIIAIRVFNLYYLKNKINLSDISFVEVRNWNSDIDKMRNFWGTPKFGYYFPTGLDKKSNPKVIFVHLKKGKLAIGFTPVNCISTISAFQENGIQVVENN